MCDSRGQGPDSHEKKAADHCGGIRAIGLGPVTDRR